MTERIELRSRRTATVLSSAWQARADELRQLMLDDGHDPGVCAEDLRVAFGDITFRDEAQRSWRHDGVAWWRWDDPTWTKMAPPTELSIDSVVFEVEREVGEDKDDLAYSTTHTVPATGMWAWAAPDATTEALALLDPWLDVEVMDELDDGWTRIRCSNGWEGWVDGQALDPSPPPQ